MHRIGLVIFLLAFQAIHSQEIRVFDLDTQEPLGNVAVYNDDRTQTAITDLNGRVDITDFSRNDKLNFNLIGYQIRRLSKSSILKRGSRVYLMMAPQQLDEVVMSISKWEQQRKDIPQKLATITAREIAFANPQTAADLLQNSGQVYVQKSQLGGGSPMIRGFATNRLLLTVDGVRMNNAIFRGGNIQNAISVDPFTIKNTEVVFGPGSVIYGSDAIGGVMNFFTKELQFHEADTLGVSGNIQLRHATVNRENTGHVDLSLSKRKWAFITSMSYNSFEDLRMGSHGPDEYLRDRYVVRSSGNDVILSNTEPRRQRPSGYDQVHLMQKVGYKPNARWQYDLGLYFSETTDFSRYDRLIRPSEDGTGLRSAEWFYGPQQWFMGKFQMYTQGRSKFYDGVKFIAAYQHFEESRNERMFQEPERFTSEEKVDAFSLNLDFENKKIGDLRLYYGLEYVINSIDSRGSIRDVESGTLNAGPSRYPDGSVWQTTAGYLNTEYQSAPNMTWLGGLRYSHVWINADFDTTFYPFPFQSADLDNGALTGSLGFSWFPRKNLQITLNGATGFRAPNIDDIGKVFDSEPGAVVVPNPDLEPEYAYNAELGIVKNFNDKVFLKGAAFYTYLVDALVRRDFTFNGQSEIEYNGELSRVQAIQNAAKAYTYGLELGLEAFLTSKFGLRGNITFTKGIEEDDDGIETPARHAAPTFADLHLLYTGQTYKLDLYFNYNGEISFEDLALSERNKAYIYAIDPAGDPFSPSWYTLNFRSQFQIGNSLRATLALENITDQRYRPYSSGIAAAGRNLVIGINFRF